MQSNKEYQFQIYVEYYNSLDGNLLIRNGISSYSYKKFNYDIEYNIFNILTGGKKSGFGKNIVNFAFDSVNSSYDTLYMIVKDNIIKQAQEDKKNCGKK